MDGSKKERDTMKKTMLDYINEAPKVVIENVKNSETLTKPLVDEFLKGHYKQVWIVASGSSYNSSLIARDYMKATLNLEVKVIAPSTFTTYEHQLDGETFVFVISQTGMSTNAIAALNKIKELGYQAIGITGDAESDFKLHADLVVDYGVGVETVGYVTKGVTTLATFLMLFALEAASKLHIVDNEKVFTDKNIIKEIMASHKETIDKTLTFIDNNFKALTNIEILYIMGFGANYGLAYEGALKIGEKVHIPALPLEMEEFIHGPNLQLSPKYTTIILDNGDDSQDRVLELYEAAKVISDKAFLITPNYKSDDKRVIKVYDPKNQLFNPLAMLPVVQVMAHKIAEVLEVADHPLLKDFKDIASAKSENYVEKD